MTREAIYWGVVTVVTLGAGATLYTQYQHTRPCAEPITYALGAIDSRFGVGNAALVSNLKEAAAIWNKVAGKKVLVYDPAAKMKINLIYDEREASAKLGSQITREQAEIEDMRAALDASQAAFAARRSVYNASVAAVNARGGASRSEATELDAERDALANEADALNARLASYNESVRAFNAKVNEFNQTAGRTFQEGQYVRDSSGERINIFEFIGTTQLERVLAHEFGHALGLDHNNDPASIMFAKNESGNLVPTASDLAALKALCGN